MSEQTLVSILGPSISKRWSYPQPTPVMRALRVLAGAEQIYIGEPNERLAFARFLAENWDVWIAFYWLARKAHTDGMDHWSARGVMHVLRWKTAARESSGKFKINNKWSGMMARLYNLSVGTDFFRTRASSG